MEFEPVIAVMADVIGSRAHQRTKTILDDIVIRLNEAYAGRLAAPFVRTQGDEIQGLLAPEASPLNALLIGTLESRLPDTARAQPLPMRWAVCYGRVKPGTGPSDRRDGQALWDAREVLAELKAESRRRRGNDSLARAVTGDHARDERLARLLPTFMEWLNDLTLVQRPIAAALAIEDPDLGPTELRRRLAERGVHVSTQGISDFLRSRYARTMLNGALPVIRADFGSRDNG